MRSGNRREEGGRKGGETLRRSRRSKRERAHDDPFRKLDLEGVVAGGLCVGECGFGGALERRLVRTLALQQLLGRARPPRLCGNAAQRKSRVADRAAVKRKRRGG